MDFGMIPPQIPKFETSLKLAADSPSCHMWSDTQFEIIKRYVEDFEASLDAEHEVGMLLTNFGQSVLMSVTQIGFEKSVLMVFKGYVNGQEATLIQHINQLSFLLKKVPIQEERPKRKIGFFTETEGGNE